MNLRRALVSALLLLGGMLVFFYAWDSAMEYLHVEECLSAAILLTLYSALSYAAFSKVWLPGVVGASLDCLAYVAWLLQLEHAHYLLHAVATVVLLVGAVDRNGTGRKRLWGSITSPVLTVINDLSFKRQAKEAFNG